MAKSRTQIAREHVARLRRKAQAYDRMVPELQLLERLFYQADNFPASLHLRTILEDHVVEEKAVQE